MSQELYTREQVQEMFLSAFRKIANKEFTPADLPLTCSIKGCNKVPAGCFCLQHYNEKIQRNVAEEKVHEDHILEPIA